MFAHIKYGDRCNLGINTHVIGHGNWSRGWRAPDRLLAGPLFFNPFSKATAWRAQGWLHAAVPGPEPTILMCTGVERRGILVQNIGSNAKTTSFA